MKRFILTLAIAVLSVGMVQAQDYNQTNTGASMTVTGTVVSTGDNQVVIRTDSGQQMTFSLDQVTMDPGRMNLDAGDRVRIEHQAGVAGATMFVATNVTEVDANDQPVTTTTTNDQYAQNQTYDDRAALPATASPLPLIGLIGIAAFLGGMGLRRYRRSH